MPAVQSRANTQVSPGRLAKPGRDIDELRVQCLEARRHALDVAVHVVARAGDTTAAELDLDVPGRTMKLLLCIERGEALVPDHGHHAEHAHEALERDGEQDRKHDDERTVRHSQSRRETSSHGPVTLSQARHLRNVRTCRRRVCRPRQTSGRARP